MLQKQFYAFFPNPYTCYFFYFLLIEWAQNYSTVLRGVVREDILALDIGSYWKNWVSHH